MKGFPISLAHTTPITLVLWLFYLSLLVIPILKIPVWKKTVCLYWGGRFMIKAKDLSTIGDVRWHSE